MGCATEHAQCRQENRGQGSVQKERSTNFCGVLLPVRWVDRAKKDPLPRFCCAVSVGRMQFVYCTVLHAASSYCTIKVTRGRVFSLSLSQILQTTSRSNMCCKINMYSRGMGSNVL